MQEGLSPTNMQSLPLRQTSTEQKLQIKLLPNYHIIIIIIIIIIITFKGAIQDFLQSPHSAANCLQHVRSSGPAQSCANHVQHIECLSRASVMLSATWYEGTAQLLSLTELKSHLFELYFVG